MAFISTYFYYHFVVYDQVCQKPWLNDYVVVGYLDGLLALDTQSAFLQFVGQRGFVDRFQEAGAQGCMYTIGGVHDLAGYRAFVHCPITKFLAKTPRGRKGS